MPPPPVSPLPSPTLTTSKLISAPQATLELPELDEAGEEPPPKPKSAGDKPFGFFAVFDGHGGSEVSEFCATALPSILAATLKKKARKFSAGRKREPLRLLFALWRRLSSERRAPPRRSRSRGGCRRIFPPVCVADFLSAGASDRHSRTPHHVSADIHIRSRT